MSKFWNTANQKIAATIGMAITGYHVISQAIPSLWQLPEFATKPLIGPVSIVVISAGLTLYGIYIFSKY